MRVKTLIALLSLFTSSAVLAYCANSYEVARDAGEVERYARDISYEANRYGHGNLSLQASQLASSASYLENSARGSYNSCAQIRGNFNRVSMDYRQLQHAYQRDGRQNRDLSYEFQRLASSFQSLSFAITHVRPVPRQPRHRPYPRPVPPRHRPHPRPVPPRHRPAPRPVPPRHRPAPRPTPPRHRPAPRPNRPGHGTPGRGNGGRGGNRGGRGHNRV